MISWATIAERLGLKAKARYDDAPAKQAEHVLLAEKLRAPPYSYALATADKIAMIRQHYDAHRELWVQPFAAYVLSKYTAHYPGE